MRIIIPQYAKAAARKGLQLRKKLPDSKKFGITKEEAEILGINSGVERAKQLIKNRTISINDAKSIRNFLNRFKNARTEKQKGAVLLWGGQRFRTYLDNILKNMK